MHVDDHDRHEWGQTLYRKKNPKEWIETKTPLHPLGDWISPYFLFQKPYLIRALDALPIFQPRNIGLLKNPLKLGFDTRQGPLMAQPRWLAPWKDDPHSPPIYHVINRVVDWLRFTSSMRSCPSGPLQKSINRQALTLCLWRWGKGNERVNTGSATVFLKKDQASEDWGWDCCFKCFFMSELR